MAFDLTHLNDTETHIGFVPYTTAIDRGGNPVMVVIAYDPLVSGCNPYYWTASPGKRPGYKFFSKEKAESEALNASISTYYFKSVDTDSIKVAAIQFTTTTKAINLGNLI